VAIGVAVEEVVIVIVTVIVIVVHAIVVMAAAMDVAGVVIVIVADAIVEDAIVSVIVCIASSLLFMFAPSCSYCSFVQSCSPFMVSYGSCAMVLFALFSIN